jgi:formylglycine-generating enzyme required for sulfatase activity
VTVKGIATRWRWIPAGRFEMGRAELRGSSGVGENALPVEVTISHEFWMLETEVTQELWTAVMGSTIEQQKSKASSGSLYGTGAKHPMYFVSYDEATEFCVKFNALLKLQPDAAGLAARLPTEAEWEYAARAGTTTPYYWGDRHEDADQYAWYRENSEGSIHPVGQKKPNAWGLYDMSGSVFEWVSDWYVDKLPGGRDPCGPATAPSAYRVMCGGWMYKYHFIYLRSAMRNASLPGNRGSAILGDDVGFRLACSSVKG